ncbi:MAG: helix-turn-helix domain-containing protein [Actinomycetales bacterium]
MDKAIHGEAQKRLTALLRSSRQSAGLRQVDVAERLGVHQSFVSKYESGERRLDLIELEQVCSALGLSLSEFVRQYQGGR